MYVSVQIGIVLRPHFLVHEANLLLASLVMEIVRQTN